MDLLEIALILATLLCSLVAGFLFAFAVVAMPGIKNLDSKEYIRAFQVIDGVIQKNQPLFVAVWLGSIIAVIVALASGIGSLDSTGRWLLILSAAAYLLGVQLPTFVINIPLNNRLQSLNVDSMDESEQDAERNAFEARWNFWNQIRTVVSCLVSLGFIILVFRY